MVAAVFSRLRTLAPEQTLDAIPSSTASLSDSTSQPDVTASGIRMSAPDPRGAHVPAAGESEAPPTETDQLLENRSQDQLEPPPIEEGQPDDEGESAPFGLASIQELLRVLISLLNPHDQQHTDSMRLMALGLLNIAFEVGGRSIGRFPSLRSMVADQLCKHLFQVSTISTYFE